MIKKYTPIEPRLTSSPPLEREKKFVVQVQEKVQLKDHNPGPLTGLHRSIALKYRSSTNFNRISSHGLGVLISCSGSTYPSYLQKSETKGILETNSDSYHQMSEESKDILRMFYSLQKIRNGCHHLDLRDFTRHLLLYQEY